MPHVKSSLRRFIYIVPADRAGASGETALIQAIPALRGGDMRAAGGDVIALFIESADRAGAQAGLVHTTQAGGCGSDRDRDIVRIAKQQRAPIGMPLTENGMDQGADG